MTQHLIQGMKLENTNPYLTDLFIDDDASDTDADGISAAAAELFVREIESITGHRLDASESARWIQELTDVSVSGDFSLGRAAVDVEFRGVIDNHLGRSQTSAYREALVLFLDTASRLLLKEDSRATTWFDLQGAFASYFELSKGIGSHSDESDKLAHRLIGDVLRKSITKVRPVAPHSKDLMRLVETFPNLEEPIRHIAEHLAMQKASGIGGLEIPPLLLVGPPGIGKTYLAIELSRLIGTQYRVISAASLTSGFVLSGTDRKWGQAAPGLVFKEMLDAGVQVPVMVLDELDKAGDGYGSRNPIGPLHELLEPSTARVFVDEFLGFAMDVSSITWIGTANEKNRIPEPILDRFQVFDVPPPSKAQLHTIVSGLYRGMASPISYLPREIPEAWLRNLENASLREVTRELKRVIGRVALAREMDPDSKASLDVESIQPAKRRKMGF